MKTKKYIYAKISLFLGLILLSTVSCERGLTEDAELATYPTNGNIFLDNFEGGLDYFPFGGSFAEAFSVDSDVKYQGTASMRFDIPVFGVGYGGATFQSLGPRDLTGYDALTFWAKASQGADINEIGFGIDGDTNNKYRVTVENLQLSTVWTKYVIPIPDPSKLDQEKGMFWYAEGAENENDEGGYTFWIDELKFEKLGTVAQPRPAIMNGETITRQTFNGIVTQISGTQTFNLGSGEDITFAVAPSYFTYSSSNESVATVNELGEVTVHGAGETTITATLGNVAAAGSLTLSSLGDFELPAAPTVPANQVISIFSEAYTSVPVDYFNGFWAPFQTTQSEDFDINGDKILNYTNFNFVGTSFSNPTVDASAMQKVHFDIYIPGTLDAGAQLKITIRDFGADGADGGGDDTNQDITISSAQLSEGNWSSLDFNLSLANKNKLGLLIYSNEGTNLTNFYVDNIYFYN